MAAAERLGAEYAQIVPGSLGSATRQANVRRIYGCRGVHVPMSVQMAAIQAFADGANTLGEITGKLHDC